MSTATATRTFTPIEHFEFPDLESTPAAQLRRIRAQAPMFRDWFRATGAVDAFAARSLVTFPYRGASRCGTRAPRPSPTCG